jgi:hypothetical protein
MISAPELLAGVVAFILVTSLDVLYSLLATHNIWPLSKDLESATLLQWGIEGPRRLLAPPQMLKAVLDCFFFFFFFFLGAGGGGGAYRLLL